MKYPTFDKDGYPTEESLQYPLYKGQEILFMRDSRLFPSQIYGIIIDDYPFLESCIICTFEDSVNGQQLICDPKFCYPYTKRKNDRSNYSKDVT